MTRRLKSGMVLLLSLTVIAGMLAWGCSPPVPASPATPKPTAAQPGTTQPSPSPSPTKPATPSVPQPKPGGILRYWTGTPAAGFDVHLKLSYSPVFSRLVFNNLVTLDPNKQAVAPENITPDLAERWESSADGMTWTFYLQKGVKWQDGTAFTADDAVYSVEKMMDPKRSALGSSFPAFKQVQKVDDSTIRVILNAPSPGFLVNLASSFAAIQCKAKASVDMKSTDFLMGTGPFMYKTSVSGVNYEFVKNPNYFKKDAAGNKLPYLDGVTAIVISDRTAQVDAFVSKRIDMSMPLTGISNQEMLDRTKSQAPEAIIQFQKSQSPAHEWFNLNYEPLKDIRVRQALALTFDQELLNTAAFGSTAFRNTQYNLFAPYYSLPTTEVRKLLGWDKPWAERVSLAKKLLADAGYANGFKLKLVLSTNTEKQRFFAVMSDIWRRELNIDSEIVPLLVTEVNKLRDAGDFGVFSQGMQTVVTDPDEVAGYFLTGNPNNFSKYSNPKLDKLLQDQSREMDPAKRRLITQEIERIVWTDVPCLPEGLNTFGVSYWPYVKGYIYQDSVYPPSIQMEQVWLDK